MRAAVMRVAAVPTGRDRQREAKHEPSENYSGTGRETDILSREFVLRPF